MLGSEPMTALERVALRQPAPSMGRHLASAASLEMPTHLSARTRIGDIVVFVPTADRMPARVTRPRYMFCMKRCEVGIQSVFDTGAVRLLRAAVVAFVVRL